MSSEDLKLQINKISRTNAVRCMSCGKCSGTCPAFYEMDIPPHLFVSKVIEGRIDELAGSKTLWRCFSCFACVERCPRTVEPAALIEAVRVTVLRKQGANHILPSDIPAKVTEELPQQAVVSAFRKYAK